MIYKIYYILNFLKGKIILLYGCMKTFSQNNNFKILLDIKVRYLSLQSLDKTMSVLHFTEMIPNILAKYF